jgi:hypothetical protein
MPKTKFVCKDGSYLKVFKSISGYGIGWYYPKAKDSCPSDAPLQASLFSDLEYDTANKAVEKFADKSYSIPGLYVFRSKQVANEALEAANLVLGQLSIWPDWAIKAKENGWKPPKGWKP